jgi:NAD(P)-dependent dehydrogenase (short-subunit alcohol dehydrogenase family)
MGLAVTERLVELGWNCAIVDFNQKRGEDVKQRLGSQILFIKSNVAIYEELSRAFVQTWKKWGRLDFGMYT